VTQEAVVLVNPRAGRRRANTAEIAEALHRFRVPHTIQVIDGIDAMRHAVIEVARSGRQIVVAGGDGTFRLAAATLVESGLAADAKPLGILPVGTGCDFLRTFGITPTLEAAAERLAGPETYRVDVGRLQGEWGTRLFLNVAQAGAGAAAAETAPRIPRFLGPVRYPIAFGARLPRFPATTVRFSGGYTYESRALAVIMANAQFFAGGWNVAPKAMLVDGELDVQVIDASKRAAPALVPRIVRGVHLGHPAVTRRSLSAFRLETDVPWPIEADGDLVGSTPVDVSVLRQVLTVKI